MNDKQGGPMQHPMIVYKSDDSDYCGLLPDFPGLFLAGEKPGRSAGGLRAERRGDMDGR